MSLTKRNLKTRPITKVTFRLPAEAANGARQVNLVGDFNDWNPAATPMQMLKNGDFKVAIGLESGREYQFRYLIDGEIWENDWDADRYQPSGISAAENSVVMA